MMNLLKEFVEYMMGMGALIGAILIPASLADLGYGALLVFVPIVIVTCILACFAAPMAWIIVKEVPISLLFWLLASTICLFSINIAVGIIWLLLLILPLSIWGMCVCWNVWKEPGLKKKEKE